MKLDRYVTGTVGAEPWYSDGSIMLKGATDQRAERTGIKMDLLYKIATQNLKPSRGFTTDTESFACPVERSNNGGHVLQPKYLAMMQEQGWKIFIGGKFTTEPYEGERYFVAKQGTEIVAICAPMRRK